MTTTALTRFDPTTAVAFPVDAAAIAEAVAPCLQMKIAGVEDVAGFKAVHEARMNLKGMRVAIEKTRTDLKADALAFGRFIDSEAKRLTAPLLPAEGHLKAEEDRIEAEKARIKREAEEDRFRKLQERMNLLWKADWDGDMTAVEAMSDEQFAAVHGAAVAFQKAALEKEAAELAERKRIEAEAAEKRRIEDEERAEARRKFQERIDAEKAEQRKVEEQRIAAERIRFAEEKAAAAERQRIEDERLAAERAELKRREEEYDARRHADELRLKEARAALDRARSEEAARAEPVEEPEDDSEESDVGYLPASIKARIKELLDDADELVTDVASCFPNPNVPPGAAYDVLSALSHVSDILHDAVESAQRCEDAAEPVEA